METNNVRFTLVNGEVLEFLEVQEGQMEVVSEGYDILRKVGGIETLVTIPKVSILYITAWTEDV